MLSICNSYKYVPGYVWFNTCLYFLSFHGTNTMMDFKMWAKHNESNSRTFLMFRFSLPKNVRVLRFFDLFAMRFFCEWNKTAPADSDIFWGSQHRHKSSTTSNHVEPSLLIVISTLFRDFWNIFFLLSTKCLIKKKHFLPNDDLDNSQRVRETKQ